MRGTPQQIIDKYSQLARDAFLSNDRVAGENFQQHAEHYTRLLAEAQREVDARRQQAEQQNRDRQQQREQRKPDPVAPAADAPAGVAAEGAEQPDLVAENPDSGLVETPESKPRKAPAKPRKPRKPAKPKAEAKPDDNAASQPDVASEAAGEQPRPDAPEAAE